MRAPLLFLGFGLALPATSSGQFADSCAAPNASVSIDHVVIAVADLQAASGNYRDLGFTLKEGRLHANGLDNQHLKFRDGTELELMTVAGEPRDEMARGYANFIRDGEGGAYLALRGSQARVLGAAADLEIAAAPLNAGGLRYATFSEPGLENVFIVEYEGRVEDPDSILTHENGALGIDIVWLEASPKLGALLSALGAVECGAWTAPDARAGARFGVVGGVIAIVHPIGSRPLIVGVRLRTAGHESASRHGPDRTHGIWLELVPYPR